MSIMMHDVICATTWNKKQAQILREWITHLPLQACQMHYSVSKINDEHTIVILPDGSKEGWPESDMGEEERALILEQLRQQVYEDGSSPWAWCHIQYGDVGLVVRGGNMPLDTLRVEPHGMED